MLSVGKFTTEEEGIKLANDTTYGLGAGLHSSTSRRYRLNFSLRPAVIVARGSAPSCLIANRFALYDTHAGLHYRR